MLRYQWFFTTDGRVYASPTLTEVRQYDTLNTIMQWKFVMERKLSCLENPILCRLCGKINHLPVPH